MKVHDQVLHAAQRLCAARGNFNFALKDAVEALPQLKATPALDTIHAVISESDGMYVVKCLEMPVVQSRDYARRDGCKPAKGAGSAA